MLIKGMNTLVPAGIGFTGLHTGYFALNQGIIIPAPPTIRQDSPAREIPKRESYKTYLQSAPSMLEVVRIMRPYNLINGEIVFYGSQNSFNHQGGALIVINGQKVGTKADLLNMITPQDVENVNISLNPTEIQKYTGLNSAGVIEIVTKRGECQAPPETGAPISDAEYSGGYRIPRSFLSANALIHGSGKDIRSTLFWNPMLEIGPEGVTAFAVPLSEIKSDFLITLEGSDRKGNQDTATAVFSVR